MLDSLHLYGLAHPATVGAVPDMILMVVAPEITNIFGGYPMTSYLLLTRKELDLVTPLYVSVLVL